MNSLIVFAAIILWSLIGLMIFKAIANKDKDIKNSLFLNGFWELYVFSLFIIIWPISLLYWKRIEIKKSIYHFFHERKFKI